MYQSARMGHHVYWHVHQGNYSKKNQGHGPLDTALEGCNDKDAENGNEEVEVKHKKLELGSERAQTS